MIEMPARTLSKSMPRNSEAIEVACLDVDPAGRVLSCDQTANRFLKETGHLAADHTLAPLVPGKQLNTAIAAANDPTDPRATVLPVHALQAAQITQINVLPFLPNRVRVILFLKHGQTQRTSAPEQMPQADNIPSLSPRETAVLRLAAAGMRRDRIAHQLNISLPTVDLHCRNFRRKLSARTTLEAIAIATGIGLLD